MSSRIIDLKRKKMHHLAVKDNVVEGQRHGGGNDLPVCPKPQRPKSPIPCELLQCFKCSNEYSQANPDGTSEILNMLITDKTMEEHESLCYYTKSPPQRTGNPLIHDVHFVKRVELFSPLASLKN